MRYSRYKRPREVKERFQVHAIWRGIGCILFIILPIMAYALGDILMREGFIQQYLRIPRIFMQPLDLDFIGLPTLQNFGGTLLLAIAITFILYAGVFMIYSLVYRIFGPSRLGPTDAPPVKGRRARKSR